MTHLRLDGDERDALWREVVEQIARFEDTVAGVAVAPVLQPGAIRTLLAGVDFQTPQSPVDAVRLVVEALWANQVHTSNPRYFGLFNPAPAPMGVVADTITAAFNPQLAAWSHAPFPAEVEMHLIRAIGEKFGYPRAAVDGTFASGGAEANHTALICALVSRFPEFSRRGLRALPSQPAVYISQQAHHSFLKAARATGLGTDAIREVPIDGDLKMDAALLAAMLRRDSEAGLLPVMLVATAGTTSAGVIDPLPELAAVARENALWFHVDAAWGGAAALVPELRHLLAGIEHADSITFDVHKFLSMPMGAGLFLTRHPQILGEAFRITTDYMPKDAAALDIAALDIKDPYTHSMQWSRRFIGLKLFLTLLVAGWDRYAEVIRHQVEMGRSLARMLDDAGWRVVNRTELPVACFVDAKRPDGESAVYLQAVADRIVTSGAAWISTTRLKDGQAVLRACITNFRSGQGDLEALVAALDEARKNISGG
jgi:glutamate/tyrosine decarboxylase-like PLP-dependent enzyme